MTLSMAPTTDVVAEDGVWRLREMVLTWEKIGILWETMKRHNTLFSDITRDDSANFVEALTTPNTLWMEVWKGDEEIVGVLWVTDLYVTIDANVHCVYFDRAPAEKDGITWEAVKWFFRNFPAQRLTAPVPALYHATIRMLKRIGFTEEGRKRNAILISGKWSDQLLFGITRPEVEDQCLDSRVRRNR